MEYSTFTRIEFIFLFVDFCSSVSGLFFDFLNGMLIACEL
jgi:hypothetical protein